MAMFVGCRRASPVNVRAGEQPYSMLLGHLEAQMREIWPNPHSLLFAEELTSGALEMKSSPCPLSSAAIGRKGHAPLLRKRVELVLVLWVPMSWTQGHKSRRTGPGSGSQLLAWACWDCAWELSRTAIIREDWRTDKHTYHPSSELRLYVSPPQHPLHLWITRACEVQGQPIQS